MVSVRDVLRKSVSPPSGQSLRALAAEVGLTQDVSGRALMTALLSPITFHGTIVTGGLAALGGTVDISLGWDEQFVFDAHLHDSGLEPYDVKVRVAVTAPHALTLVFQCSGHTDGTLSDPFGDPKRSFDHHEQATNPLIKTYWMDLRRASIDVSKSYEDSGIVAVAEDALKALVGFLVADVTLGAGLALVVACSAELSDAFDGNFAGPGGLVGVLVAGGIAWVWGPSAILASVAGGVAAGAITDALVDHRSMTEAEYAFAQVVFGDTLPPRDRIYITNLSRDDGRSFTWPNVDHSILLNINQAYADPVNYVDVYYPKRGQLLIHELTHAWQIHTEDFVPGLICERETRDGSYSVDTSKAWDDLGLEQQAKTVDVWFAAYCGTWATLADLATNLASDLATRDDSFPYVSDHLRLGTN